jgi:hypothetical protein
MLLLITITVSLRSVTDPVHRQYTDKYCYFMYNGVPLDVWAHTDIQLAPSLVTYYQRAQLKPKPDLDQEGLLQIPANSPVRLVGYHQDDTIAEVVLLPEMEGAPHVFIPAQAVHDVVSSRQP